MRLRVRSNAEEADRADARPRRRVEARASARRRPIATAALSLLALLASLPLVAPFAEFSRDAIASSEVWRLLTGHLSHWSLPHLAWDLGAFAVLASMIERQSRRRLLWLCGATALAVSASVAFGHPHLTHYRGLSGIDSALFASVATALVFEALRARRRGDLLLALGMFAGFGAKLAAEATTGSALFVASSDEVALVSAAHVVGAGAGLVDGLLASWRPRARHEPTRGDPHPASFPS